MKNPSAPSDAAIDTLLAGGRLTSDRIQVGPLSPNAAHLLRVLWQRRDEITRKKGTDQATAICEAFLSAGHEGCLATSPSVEAALGGAEGDGVEVVPQACWRLHWLRCCSFRGVAPLGTVFEFTFDGHPTLIYGPNGSGKSSLINVIGWVLTGRVVIDADDDAEKIPLYAPAKAGVNRTTKLCDWPVVHTLPHTGDPGSIVPDCWAELLLKSLDETRSLYLRRRHGASLEESDDGLAWRECISLGKHGISPLDLHLSIIAATVFGRRSLEASDDTRHLLSMLLGYDALEDLGGQVTTLAANLTRKIKQEQEELASRRERLRGKLAAQPGRLRDDLPLVTNLATLTGADLPTAQGIADTHELVVAQLEKANRELAALLGITGEPQVSPVRLVDALTSAVVTLRRPIERLFPTLVALRPSNVPAVAEDGDDPLEAAEKALAEFERKATEQIQTRLIWRTKETAPDQNNALLIQAAARYDETLRRCPVCDQSVVGLAVEASLRDLKTSPAELRASLREFFADLIEELSRIVPRAVQGLGEKSPAQCLLDDWQHLSRELGASLAPVVAPYDTRVKALAESLPAVNVKECRPLPANADLTFTEAAGNFLAGLHSTRRSLATLRWANTCMAELLGRLEEALTADTGATPSLYAALRQSKNASADIVPLAAVRDELAAAATEASALIDRELRLAALEDIRSALDETKPLGKYAEAKVQSVFEDIKGKTIENVRKLYPNINPILAPSRLHLNKGRDKTVEAYLAGCGFEIPGQYVANAGLMRAIALAFYFALLDHHPRGLGFVIMDDPILSLDDDHREAWASNVLRPALEATQVIVATHQRQFLNNCKTDFRPGRLVELNPRTRSSQITWRPGDRLDRVEELLSVAWTSAPNEMRKYREEVIITLHAYCTLRERLTAQP